MTYLLLVVKSREKSAAFVAIGLIAQAIGINIKRHLPKIMEAIRSALPSKDMSQK
jgi:hypothetical protein